MSLRRTLAFRANLFFDVVLALIGVGAALTSVLVVFTQTNSLVGWSRAEAFVLIGTFQLLTGLKGTFIDPNLSWFPENAVRNGKLDTYLLQPAPSLFLASLAMSSPLALLQSWLGLAVVGVGISEYGHLPSLSGFLAWLVLLAVGLVITWTLGVLFACLAFWAPRLQLDVFYGSAWQLARYPVAIYRRPLRLLLTYVFPMALIATQPAGALLHGLRPMVMVGSVAGAAGSALLALICWRLGLRRYTGATS